MAWKAGWAPPPRVGYGWLNVKGNLYLYHTFIGLCMWKLLKQSSSSQATKIAVVIVTAIDNCNENRKMEKDHYWWESSLSSSNIKLCYHKCAGCSAPATKTMQVNCTMSCMIPICPIAQCANKSALWIAFPPWCDCSYHRHNVELTPIQLCNWISVVVYLNTPFVTCNSFKCW